MKMHPVARLARVSIGVPEAHMAICVASRHEQEVAPWLQAIGEGVDQQNNHGHREHKRQDVAGSGHQWGTVPQDMELESSSRKRMSHQRPSAAITGLHTHARVLTWNWRWTTAFSSTLTAMALWSTQPLSNAATPFS